MRSLLYLQDTCRCCGADIVRLSKDSRLCISCRAEMQSVVVLDKCKYCRINIYRIKKTSRACVKCKQRAERRPLQFSGISQRRIPIQNTGLKNYAIQEVTRLPNSVIKSPDQTFPSQNHPPSHSLQQAIQSDIST